MTMGNTIMYSVTKESTESEGDNGLGIFDSEGTQKILYQINYKIKFILYRVQVSIV